MFTSINWKDSLNIKDSLSLANAIIIWIQCKHQKIKWWHSSKFSKVLILLMLSFQFQNCPFPLGRTIFGGKTSHGDAC